MNGTVAHTHIKIYVLSPYFWANSPMTIVYMPFTKIVTKNIKYCFITKINKAKSMDLKT